MNLSHGEGLVDPQGPLGAGPVVDNGAGADAAAVGGSESRGAFAVAGDDGRPADVVAVGADEKKAVGNAQGPPIESGPIGRCQCRRLNQRRCFRCRRKR
jgi:hypothetical protein